MCASRGANVDRRCRRVDVSAGSRWGEVYITGTNVYYESVRYGEANVTCVRFVWVGTT